EEPPSPDLSPLLVPSLLQLGPRFFVRTRLIGEPRIEEPEHASGPGRFRFEVIQLFEGCRKSLPLPGPGVGPRWIATGLAGRSSLFHDVLRLFRFWVGPGIFAAGCGKIPAPVSASASASARDCARE